MYGKIDQDITLREGSTTFPLADYGHQRLSQARKVLELKPSQVESSQFGLPRLDVGDG